MPLIQKRRKEWQPLTGLSTHRFHGRVQEIRHLAGQPSAMEYRAIAKNSGLWGSHARNGCGSSVLANRNSLSFRLREGDGADAAIAFSFEQ